MPKNVQKPADPLGFPAVVAHQLSAPIAAVASVLDVLLGEYAGPISPRQRELLERANARCQEALATVRRLMTLATAARDSASSSCDLAKLVREAERRFARDAAQHDIRLSVDAELDPAWVRGADASLVEMLNSLLSNALKYTPDHGQVRVSVRGGGPGALRLSVSDSGIGVPDEDRENIFLPFHRSSIARGSARPGVGLGLAFAKSIVDGLGGSIRVEKSALGGAEFIAELPPGKAPESALAGEERMSVPFRVVVVGGVAAGPKVASKTIRLRPDAEVTVVERGEVLSYAGCGLPYYVSGVVKEPMELMSTPTGVVRDSVFFQKVKHVRVLNRTEAVEVNRAEKRVRIRQLPGGEESWLEYDKLVLATGAGSIVPAIPGVDLANIFTLHGVKDAEGIKAALAAGKAKDVVIVGGGLIGVEMTEALVSSGCRVTIVEMLPQILRILDWEVAHLVERYLESQGVKVLTNTKVESFVGRDGKVAGVVTASATFPADLVILAIGVRPNVQLAREAGLRIGTTGAIKVDEQMRTSDPDVYAAGDCVECTDLVTGRPCYVPLGSTANKQGRVAAINLSGGRDTFPGVLGSTICKVFDYSVGRTGLTEAAARKAAFDVVTVLAPGADRADYMPNAKPILMKLVVDRRSRRLLGAQAVGPGVCDKRIDVAAMAITAGMTVDALANADLCYAPPYSPAMDNIITAANIARNKLDGHMSGLSPIEVHRMLSDGSDFVFLDVRTPGEHEQVRLPKSTLIPLGALRPRLAELPKGKTIVTFCKISLRGYEAALVLKAAGFTDVHVMDGGITMWPFEKIQ